jgi:hypothetical protein
LSMIEPCPLDSVVDPERDLNDDCHQDDNASTGENYSI